MRRDRTLSLRSLFVFALGLAWIGGARAFPDDAGAPPLGAADPGGGEAWDDTGDSPARPPEGELDVPIETQYVFLGSGPYRKTFAVIADPHVGAADGREELDYAYGTGWNDPSGSPPNGYGADLLGELVSHVNGNWTRGITREWWADGQRVTGRVEFVIVVGDITQTGELSEFARARRILDTLSIPYAPLPGNHDVVPHVYANKGRYGPLTVTWSWSDQVSSVRLEDVRAEGIVVYGSPNYNHDFDSAPGTEARSQVFFSDARDLREQHIGNDAIRSIRCVRTSSNAQHCEYQLFLAAGFNTGYCYTDWLSRDVADLESDGLYCLKCRRTHTFYRGGLDPEGISSLKVRYGDPGNSPVLYSDENYGGRAEYLLLDDANLRGNRIGNDSLDSVWIPEAPVRARAILYEAADFDLSEWGCVTVTESEYRIGHASPGWYRGVGNVFGDRHFDAEFAPVYTALAAAFPNWKQHPGACYVSDTARYIDTNPGCVWLENFAFDVGDYNFLCLDFSLRKRWSYDWPGRQIAGGTGNARTYAEIADGTLPWAIGHLARYPNKRSENVLVFAHFPPISLNYWPYPEMAFSDVRTLRDAFVPYRDCVNAWFAGHVHRAYREEIYHDYGGATYHLFSSVETNSSLRPQPHNPPGGGIECLTIVTVASERPFPPLEPIDGAVPGSLVACYDFDERKLEPKLGRGIWGLRDTQVYDLSGYAFGGILRSTGSAEYFPGVSGSAISWNGDDWVEVDCSSPGFESPLKPAWALTVEAWVRPSSAAAVDAYALALGEDWGLYLRDDRLWYRFRDLGGASREGPIGEVPPGRWTHVALAYDGTWIRGCLDGRAVRTERASGRIRYASDRLYIGARGPGEGLFQGSIDNVRIWSRGLSANEISAHAQLVAYWAFDEGEPGRTGYRDWTIFDRSANANHARGRSEGDASFEWVSGVRGSAMAFSGDDWVEAPSSWSIDFEDAYTVEAWAYLEDSWPDQKIVSRTDPFGRRGFSLGVISGALYPEVWVDGLRYSFVAGSVPARRWARLRMTWDGATLRGYVDGTFVGAVGVPSGGGAPRTPDGVLTAGCASWSRAFKVRGRIDEVRLWNRALGSGEPAELEGLAPPEGELESAGATDR
ncbi:MAG: LamG-like jellyroll fold domain-containing protein [Planctomycetota bacterium]